MQVTRRHRVAHVSIIDALGPFDTPEAERWFVEGFNSDKAGHPSVTGALLPQSAASDSARTEGAACSDADPIDWFDPDWTPQPQIGGGLGRTKAGLRRNQRRWTQRLACSNRV